MGLLSSIPVTSVLALIVSLGAAVPAAGQGTVHVVDVNNGAGTDFTSITSAISAAVAGDTLLIRAGNYDEFPGISKGITLMAELGAVVTVTDLAVSNVPADETVVFRGLTVTEGPGVTPGTFRVQTPTCSCTTWWCWAPKAAAGPTAATPCTWSAVTWPSRAEL